METNSLFLCLFQTAQKDSVSIYIFIFFYVSVQLKALITLSHCYMLNTNRMLIFFIQGVKLV